MEISSTYILAALICAGYLAMLAYSLRRSSKVSRARRWLRGTLMLALIGQTIHFVVPEAHLGPLAPIFVGSLTQPAIAVLLMSTMLAGYGALTARYLGGRFVYGLFGLSALLWIGLFFGAVSAPEKVALGQAGWITAAFGAENATLSLATLGYWLLLGTITLVAAVYSFATAHLAEVANRSMFWLLMTPLVLMGALIGVSGSSGLREIGWLMQISGLFGVTYAVLSLRVLDVRRIFRLTFASALTLAITFLVIVGAILITQNIPDNDPNRLLLVIGAAAAATALYVPLRLFSIALVDRVFGAPTEDSTAFVRQYSQDIAGVVELPELSDMAIGALRNALRVKHAGVLLATSENNETIRMEPMRSNLSEMPELRGWLPRSSPIYATLFEQRRPLLQYDIEYSRDYLEVAPELKSFFKQLRMSAYAPIIMQGQIIGILAMSAKSSDDPFSPQDLELFTTLATQTGVALRNARLVSDLRKARDETQALNRDIISTKERLELLDSVKTDFVTIASHELRTPLTQILGYTDILDTLSQQPMIEPDRVGVMTGNIRKATERLEALIADMLDVSRLGLDAMDLRFVPTSLDAVLRLSIEPLQENIKQRKLQLTARGLKGLPEIEADQQRMVQAFKNVVLNAIKYTPDGGRIDITARLEQDADDDEVIHVEIKDTGIGIDPRNHELIFEKFFRVGDPGLHSTGATKFMGAGPGLGLTIARGVISAHGGRIWIESSGMDMEKLPGTTVHIVLPTQLTERDKSTSRFEVTSPYASSARLPTPSAGLPIQG
ncbi:MAG: GAF domain-containing protein [Chloroflexi bacterium CFX4]|nr:GAF domain-containing protein [Chloroflexi bacterium CFX4]MDL1923444.1 GAF domain-containing protein [Chloroflexi bacterium CFX3]